jgi:hypothetical protein
MSSSGTALATSRFRNTGHEAGQLEDLFGPLGWSEVGEIAP